MENVVEWYTNNAWAIWLTVALLLVIIEMFTLDFHALLLGASAAITAIPAAFGGNFIFQAIVFVIAAALLLRLVRPIALKHLQRGNPAQRTNVVRLHGSEAIVLEETTALTGLAKINGEEWTARSDNSELVISPGTKCYVNRIQGATAYLVLDRPIEL